MGIVETQIAAYEAWIAELGAQITERLSQILPNAIGVATCAAIVVVVVLVIEHHKA